MVDFESSKEQIAKLVEEFKANEKYYKSVKFDEENTKINFINKFFIALGWDVYNDQGFAPLYKDVEFEDTVIINGKPKSPDYSFRIGGKIKFFVEAKASHINIEKNKRYAFQLKRYTWSKKLPVGLLTDFEELSIYCPKTTPKKTHRPDIDRIKYYKYTDYVENWEEIYNIYSKEAVLAGKFDNYFSPDDTGGFNPTSTVDTEFLKTIEDWRKDLAKNIAKRNKNLLVEELNFAVQLIIDRIIFLRIAEDRGIEDYGKLKRLLELSENKIDKCPVYEGFIKLCRDADEKYNSGLFHFAEEKDIDLDVDTLTPSLHVDDGTLKKIIKGLYYPDSPYEFSMISTEILGNIYEQFLGKVIRLTDSRQVRVEEKPEVKKSGGIYYTPQHIVDYIVENTLGEFLKGKTPDMVSQLKVVDPACGSGSFLLGAYQKLLDWHADYYSNIEPYPSEIYLGEDGILRLTIQEKKRILLNNIYGVDIDPQAVEVTKLSLLLKVLEDENKEVLENQQKSLKERALPYLGCNIKCGNSLVGTDFIDLDDSTTEKIHRVNPFDWEYEFPEIFDKRGFDIVIGNPPYVRYQRIKDIKPYLENHYSCYLGTADLYVYFFEKAINLLKEGGYLSYICSNKYARTNYGKKLRKFLLSKSITHYTDYTAQDVFKSATVEPSVIEIKNVEPKNNKILVDNEYYMNQNNLDYNSFVFNRLEVIKLREKIFNKGILIKNLDIEINYGIKTAFNKAFIIDSQLKNELINRNSNNKNVIKPVLRGRDIQKNFIDFNQLYLLYIPWDFKINQFPELKEYLTSFKKELSNRSEVKNGRYKWFALHRYASNYVEKFSEDKIVYSEIASEPRFSFDNENYFLDASGFIMNSNTINLKYLLSLLNSKLLFWYFKGVSPNLGGSGFRYQKVFVEQIPIIIAPLETQNKLIKFTDDLMELNKELAACKIPNKEKLLKLQINKIEEKVDRLVYELYDLTDDEIEIVESSLN